MFKMYNVNALETNIITRLLNVKISFGISTPILPHWRCMNRRDFLLFKKVFFFLLGLELLQSE